MAAKEPQPVSIPLIWVGVEDVPVLFVNQMLSQVDRDEFTLTFGQTTPPPIIGTPEQAAAQLKDLSYVGVKAGRSVLPESEASRGTHRRAAADFEEPGNSAGHA